MKDEKKINLTPNFIIVLQILLTLPLRIVYTIVVQPHTKNVYSKHTKKGV